MIARIATLLIALALGATALGACANMYVAGDAGVHRADPPDSSASP